jgi:uncharacterized protein
VMLRWWDRWLKGVPNGAEDDAALRAYVLHGQPPDASAAYRAGEWVQTAWPAPTVPLILPLSDKGLVAGPLHAKVQTPQHHGLHAGEFFPMGLNAEMPGDQGPDDALAVCFDGMPFDADLTLMGAAEVTLTLSSDTPKAHLIARLCDVGPDGQSVRIAHGMLNLCHRGDTHQPKPMSPGRAEEVTLRLDQMAYRVPAGHHLRLSLATSYWPFVWPSDANATLTLTAGSITLPILNQTLPLWTPPPVETAKPWAHRRLRDGHAARVIEHDLIRGTQSLCITDDGGDVENAAHGLCTGETMTERWTIHPDDPLSATATRMCGLMKVMR